MTTPISTNMSIWVVCYRTPRAARLFSIEASSAGIAITKGLRIARKKGLRGKVIETYATMQQIRKKPRRKQ